MKKITILAAIFCLCFQAISVSAATPDFSGYWELDASKSTFPEAGSIESITLKVLQTEKELKIESTIRARQDLLQAQQMSGGGKSEIAIYSFENKETIVEVGTGKAARKEIRNAILAVDDKLSLTLIRIFKGENGNATVKINEIWELLDDGKVLKATRYAETPDGAATMVMYFRKKGPGILTIKGTGNTPGNQAVKTDAVPSRISGGVLNGKAQSLPLPAYPAAAKAVKASGAVNVQVTINEAGSVVSANAVSGHPMLRPAAVQAARASKFSPTLLSGQPVSVSGIIIYNFNPQ